MQEFQQTKLRGKDTRKRACGSIGFIGRAFTHKREHASHLPFVRHYMLDRTSNEGMKKEIFMVRLCCDSKPEGFKGHLKIRCNKCAVSFDVHRRIPFVLYAEAGAFGRGAKPMKRRMVRSGKWKGAEERGKSASATILENYSTRLEGLWLGNDIEHTDNIHS
ncbi:hypothetical protein V1477_010823 [Vespula maculifrons]|uniref:Uncharacterized protein n=1 Tax=Vespula maculifrons TaxID=7453 RepID=A0ABD2C316_VESMC